jgi:hypothetical protein
MYGQIFKYNLYLKIDCIRFSQKITMYYLNFIGVHIWRLILIRSSLLNLVLSIGIVLCPNLSLYFLSNYHQINFDYYITGELKIYSFEKLADPLPNQ